MQDQNLMGNWPNKNNMSCLCHVLCSAMQMQFAESWLTTNDFPSELSFELAVYES